MKQSCILMALWWLCGGYAFPVVVKPDILTFEIKFDLDGHGQSPSKTTGSLSKVFCASGLNLIILGWTGDKLWCGQAQNWVNLDFKIKFDLEYQGQSLYKTIGFLTKVFYKCVDPSLTNGSVLIKIHLDFGQVQSICISIMLSSMYHIWLLTKTSQAQPFLINKSNIIPTVTE